MVELMVKQLDRIGNLGLVDIKLGNEEKDGQVEDVEDPEECIVVIQMRHIEVVPNPTFMIMSTRLRHARHRRQQKTAHKIPQTQRRHRVRRAKTLHALWSLVVEKLYLRHFKQRVGTPHQHELRQQHEYSERHPRVLCQRAMARGHLEPVAFGERGDEHD